MPSEIKPPLADVLTYRFGNKLSFARKTFRNVRCNVIGSMVCTVHTYLVFTYVLLLVQK